MVAICCWLLLLKIWARLLLATAADLESKEPPSLLMDIRVHFIYGTTMRWLSIIFYHISFVSTLSIFLQGQWNPGVACSGHFDSVEDFIWDPSGKFALTVSACISITRYFLIFLYLKYRSVSTRPLDSMHHGFKSLTKRFYSTFISTATQHANEMKHFENLGDVAWNQSASNTWLWFILHCISRTILICFRSRRESHSGIRRTPQLSRKFCPHLPYRRAYSRT